MRPFSHAAATRSRPALCCRVNITHDWLTKWRIKASAPKSHHIIRLLRLETCPSVNLGRDKLPQSTCVKFGVLPGQKNDMEGSYKNKRNEINFRFKTSSGSSEDSPHYLFPTNYGSGLERIGTMRGIGIDSKAESRADFGTGIVTGYRIDIGIKSMIGIEIKNSTGSRIINGSKIGIDSKKGHLNPDAGIFNSSAPLSALRRAAYLGAVVSSGAKRPPAQDRLGAHQLRDNP
ncbi:hypothetical protein EVAR_97472_1 [Eumeta japonica]|uniref:Uncharacterized protein n=1 Tax=Eumeta variegata TaxID=151549 RepID=A0A4C2A573_EUMVA|nr:hypothetical protein EVAR_97472_1 [Eumeta japonica]